MNIKKAKSVNKKVVPKTSQNEYKDVLLNKKCFRYLMNRIPSTNLSIGPYEMNKNFSSCFDDKFYIFYNGIQALTLDA